MAIMRARWAATLELSCQSPPAISPQRTPKTTVDSRAVLIDDIEAPVLSSLLLELNQTP